MSTALRRSIGLPFLVFYGLGTMVGGGFYALMGKVAGAAGSAAPLAFALTGLLALLTALSFAELSSRYPVSAGAAQYIRMGFGSVALSSLAGWLVILTGVVSAAALSVASVGFLQQALDVDAALVTLLLVALLTALSAWGIQESVAAVAAITLIEVAALVYVLAVNGGSLAELPTRWPELLPGSATGGGWVGVFAGAFLAFYAFIGFEDMVNLAEEVRDVRRNLPRAILISLTVTIMLYVSVVLVAVLSVPVQQLADAATPVAELAPAGSAFASRGLWLVSLLTGLNGALVQIIMAARVAYGMARRDQAPAWMGRVHARRRTPWLATFLMGAATLVLALVFPLTELAKATSAIILLIFAGVNLSLWRIQARDPDRQGEGPRYPRSLSLAGGLSCLLVLGFQLWQMAR